MRHFITVVAIAVALIPAASHASSPAPSGTSINSTGSASNPPCGAPQSGGACFGTQTPLTPAQSRYLGLKEDIARKAAAGELSTDPNAAREMLGLAPTHSYNVSARDAGAAAITPDSSGNSGGWWWVSMNKWVEADGGCSTYNTCSPTNDGSDNGNCYGTANGYANPSVSEPAAYYYNKCGPGASEAIISHWNSKPTTWTGQYYTGYVSSQGLHWLGYMFYLSDQEQTCGSYTTCDTTLASTVNSEIGQTYYYLDGCAGSTSSCASFNRFQSDVNTDIVTNKNPLVDFVETCYSAGNSCEAGWPYAARHFQSISQVNPSAEQVEYAETGNSADTCYFGYSNPAPGHFSGSWTDPSSGYTFNDSDGWDYSGEYFQWERSLELIW